MGKNRRIRGILFYLILAGGIFGVYIIYLAYVIYRQKPLPNPPGDYYQIRGVLSPTYPDALFYDFEPPQETEDIFSRDAYSGDYSLAAPPSRSHSPVIKIPLGHWGEDKLGSLSIQAWVKTSPGDTTPHAFLVTAITNNLNDVLFSHAIPIRGKDVPCGSWFQVSTNVETGSYQYHYGDRIRIYLWNEGQYPVYMDDLTISLGSFIVPDKKINDRHADKPVSSVTTNTPPYPWLLLDKFMPECESLPDSENMIVAGHFLSRQNQGSDIIRIKEGCLEIYYYQALQGDFLIKEVAFPELVAVMNSTSRIFCGNVEGDQGEEILIIPEGSHYMHVLNPKGTYTTYKIEDETPYQDYCLLDLLGDSKPELLCINADGYWSLSVLINSTWKTNPSLKGRFGPARGQKGKFQSLCIPGLSEEKDHLWLCFEGENKLLNQVLYLKYNQGENKFESLFDDPKNIVFQGSDTLSPNDHYFYAGSGPQGILLLRQRKDWRYDVKLINVKHDGYTILNNIDYTCSNQEINPRFYPECELLSGDFIRKGQMMLLLRCSSPRKSRKLQAGFPGKTMLYYLPEEGADIKSDHK